MRKSRLAKGAVAVCLSPHGGQSTADNIEQKGKSSNAGRTRWMRLSSPSLFVLASLMGDVGAMVSLGIQGKKQHCT